MGQQYPALLQRFMDRPKWGGERSRKPEVVEDKTRQLHIWPHSDYDLQGTHIRSNQSSQCGVGRWSWSPTLSWGATGSRWLLGKEGKDFFNEASPERSFMFCPCTYCQPEQTQLLLVVGYMKLKESSNQKDRRGTRVEEMGAGLNQNTL